MIFDRQQSRLAAPPTGARNAMDEHPAELDQITAVLRDDRFKERATLPYGGAQRTQRRRRNRIGLALAT
ncbi:hypothetical protein DEJ01_09775 [Curtobacterium sp. MCLR17_040]|uniref:hypothetical protein n=1 Tax=Curtobacterium sp. MCLR17_040 TaxID=2175625 RepID=UPI000DA841CA|nr:hypothetical protein [Curtobacterium sp. MCLR17_040]PZF02806.1 hypothetical protein DEJ01_09775 [Curtobacterium sp. MCLR17_040]